MSNDNVIKLIQPGFFDDQLTEILRNGARALLAKAVEAEVADFLDKHADLKTQDGHQRVVRHGHLPEREVMTGIGPVAVRQPRVRDREADAADPGRIRFSPSILPPYMRRSKSIETLLPVLYLKGISTGDFSEALAALLGKDAAGLSASAIGRLKDGWLDEHAAWQKHDLLAKRYVYIWADHCFSSLRRASRWMPRCSRVFGQTSPAAFQNPSAPSAMTSCGAPRRFISSSRSRQSCALSRAPSVKPTSSLRPSGVAPISTRMQDRLKSSGSLDYAVSLDELPLSSCAPVENLAHSAAFASDELSPNFGDGRAGQAAAVLG